MCIKYKNLPSERHGTFHYICKNQLPERFELVKTFQYGKVHVKVKNNNHTCLCDRWKENGVTLNAKIKFSDLCSSCLAKLDKEMEGYMYDSNERRWYDPFG